MCIIFIFVYFILYLWFIKSLVFVISYCKNMMKFFISIYMSIGKSYFFCVSFNIGEINFMIRIISKIVMIKICNND